jgi:CHASE2 domain-containing sensor protein
MSSWDRITNRIGALPARRLTWALVLVFALWVLLDVLVLKLTGGVAQSSFDAMVRARFYAAPADPRIVIIDIDESSLSRMGAEFGRWPWPRDTLATVLDHVERQQPAAVVWDVLFADADRLSPGGDAAFNAAANRSAHSHFSVVRLPKANDVSSQITQKVLPGLWLTPAPSTTSVALIAPALPAVASSRLGFNNGYVDRDGVLRRYQYAESLADASVIQSIAMSVLCTMNSVACSAYAASATGIFYNELIAWRGQPNSYPRISFADVFAQAEGGKPRAEVPSFAGKVVIIGSTAPSLHDIHPTPLSPSQAGVDALATVIDNALNQRHIAELPRWLQAALAIVLCVAMALWVQFKSVAALAPALLALPVTLLGISFLSLNGLPVFLDLHLAAGLALVFLAVLRYWSSLRRSHWCSLPSSDAQPLVIWPLERKKAWQDEGLDRLIDVLERHAPKCRVVICDAHAVWPATLRWPELTRFAAVVGAQSELMAAHPKLRPALYRLAHHIGEPVLLTKMPGRTHLANEVLQAWAKLQSTPPITPFEK